MNERLNEGLKNECLIEGMNKWTHEECINEELSE